MTPPPDSAAASVTGGIPNVLVVCTGNLCRSPLVAALLERDLAMIGAAATVRSVGTDAPVGSRSDRRLLKAAREVGIDLDGHRATLLSPRDLTADLILTMDAGHDARLAELDPASAARTVRLRRAAWRAQVFRADMSFEDWVARLTLEPPAPERPKRDGTDDIADPYGGPMRGYRAMAAEVSDLVGLLARRWQGR